MKSFYTRAVDGSEIKLLEIYESHGEEFVVFEDEDGQELELPLEEFEEFVNEEVVTY